MTNHALRFLSFEHVPQEGIGALQDYIRERGATVTSHRQYAPPAQHASHQDYDVLVAMGGPMSVHDVGQHSWLESELRFIREAIGRGKHVVGVCLGAQLIAAALGAEVRQGSHQEIGWSPIRFTDAFLRTAPGAGLPPQLEVLHWHGDTFEVPAGAVRMADSAAYPNQGFLYGERVLALQFHMEMGPPEAAVMVDHFRSQLQPDRFVQSGEKIQAGAQAHAGVACQALFAMLDRWFGIAESNRPEGDV